MTSKEIREKFLEFFKERDHAVVSSSSLIPDDTSVLLTTAGMQQFKKYFTGELDVKKDFGKANAVSVQKCFRTSDVDEVGDASHLTFFEMLGNFSFGGYFKKKAIQYAYDFIVKELGLAIDYVSVFSGDSELPPDVESEKIWKSLGVTDIKKFGREDNFWGPTGSEGPCGPTTELYIGDIEVWNIVFNEYYCDAQGKLTKLKQPGIDTGMGLERLVMAVQKAPTIFDTDLFQQIIDSIIEIIGDKPISKVRLIADHLKAAAFLIADGVEPSNVDAGYILRRLIRRAMLAHYKYISGGLDPHFYEKPVEAIVSIYKDEVQYKLLEKKEEITEIFERETKRFSRTLENGLKVFGRRMKTIDLKNLPQTNIPDLSSVEGFPGYTPSVISGKWLFDFYQSFGFPLELSLEELESRGFRFTNLEKEKLLKEFQQEMEKHKEISRAGAGQKFGGHGLVLDTGELKAGSEEEAKKATRLHTATHLLHQALRDVVGSAVSQRGSDISAERTRFDFSLERKLTPDELKRVEDIVNEKIKENLLVKHKEMTKEEAEKTGALSFFKEKYPDVVKVYYIGEDLEKAYSKEFCAGPHVERTGEIGKFKILKQESVGRDVKRIRATVK